MSEKNVRKPLYLGPVLVSLFLLAAILGCVGSIFAQQSALAEAQGGAAEVARLEKERDALKELLEVPPCEAKKRRAGLVATSAMPPAAAHTATPAPEAAGAPPAAARPGTPAPAGGMEEVEDGCVFLISADREGNLRTGTGFFVAPDTVLTNNHVVAGAAGRILATSASLGQPVLASLVASEGTGGHDYALLRVPLPAGAHARPLFFAPEAKRTQRIGAWGYPNLVGKNDPRYRELLGGKNIAAVPELSYSEGVVSAVLARTPPLIVHTAPISPGNSGGPLVDAHGDVVGINTMITLDEESYRQASIALSGEDVCRFLRAHGVTPKTR